MAQIPNIDVTTISVGGTAYTVPFEYQTQAEVFVTVDGSPVAFTWINAGNISITPAPMVGAAVRRYRSTAATSIRHDYRNGVPFTPKNIAENNDQLLYVVQEAVSTSVDALTQTQANTLLSEQALATADAALATADAAEATVNTAAADVAAAVVTANNAAARIDDALQDSALYLRNDLANATDPAKGAVLIGYRGRSVHARLFDSVHYDDFGCIGDGSLHPLSERYNTLADAQVDYPFVSSLSQSIDWAAIQAAVNTGRPVRVHGHYPQRVYHMGNDSVRTTPSLQMTIIGDGARRNKFVCSPGFQGWLFSPAGSYDIEGVEIYGNGEDGCYLIGNNDVGSGGGGARLNSISLYNCDGGVYFGKNYQHPLGLHYDRVHGQIFRTFGCSIGGLPDESGSGFAGESAYSFGGTVIFTNANSSGIEYTSTVTANSPSATQDTISWIAASIPRFGFCVLRSADGLTNWHVPPNWTRADYKSTSFVASKSSGETWNYKVIRMTAGIHISRAKAISGDVVQSENFGVGLYADGLSEVHIQAFYYENSNNSNGSPSPVPRPNFAGVWSRSSGRVNIGTIWCEYAGYAAYAADNSTINIEGIDASKCFWSALGASGATDQFISYRQINLISTPDIHRAPNNGSRDRQFEGLDYSNAQCIRKISHDTKGGFELWRGGIKQGEFYADNSGIGSRISANQAVIRPRQKSLQSPPIQANSALGTALTNNVATNILQFTVPSNGSVALLFAYAIHVTYSGAGRQMAGGLLNISGINVGGGATTVASVVASLLSKAVANDSLGDPAFTTSVSGSTVSVACAINSTGPSASITLRLTPLSMVGSGDASSITQL